MLVCMHAALPCSQAPGQAVRRPTCMRVLIVSAGCDDTVAIRPAIRPLSTYGPPGMSCDLERVEMWAPHAGESGTPVRITTPTPAWQTNRHCSTGPLAAHLHRGLLRERLPQDGRDGQVARGVQALTQYRGTQPLERLRHS